MSFVFLLLFRGLPDLIIAQGSTFSCSLLKQDMEVVILSADTPEGIGNYCGSHVDTGLHLPRKKWITALSWGLKIFCAPPTSSDASGRPVGILNTILITQHPMCVNSDEASVQDCFVIQRL
ncbi:hypothetical protein C8R48DRAFT_37207 [Suillus tomentosus]|nr:hypothetical protein C8R48DRAFT_37207 [Suillus tomentosus]